MLLRRVVVHIGVLPTIAEITLVGVVDHQSPPDENPKPLRRLAIVLVNLRNTGWEIVHQMVDGMLERYLHQRPIRKEPGDLAAEGLIEAVVVVDVEESALQQPAPQDNQFLIRPVEVAVARDVEVGNVPQLCVGEPNGHFLGRGTQRGPLTHGGEEIRQRGGIGIPVPTPVIMQPSDRERTTLQR